MADTRRLAPLDAAFLYYERQPHQRLYVGCVALLEGRVPFLNFVAAMAERLGTIRRYRQRPHRPLLDLDWPRWEDDPDFDVRHHVRHVAVPPPGRERDLHELVDTLLVSRIDETHPLWETYLIDGLADGRSALLCKVHHAMIDGVSGAQVLETMADLPERDRRMEASAGAALDIPGLPETARMPDGPGMLGMLGMAGMAGMAGTIRLSRSSGMVATPAPRDGGVSPFSRIRKALRSAASPGALLGRARDAMAAASTLVPLLLEPISDLPFTGRLSDARRVVWASFALDDFLAIRGAAGCKVNDVVLAVIAGTLRRYLESRGVGTDHLRVRTLVPVSIRRAEDRLTLGNLVTPLFPTLPVHVADPVERLRRVAADMRALKEQGQAQAAGTMLQLLGALPAPLNALLGRMLPDRALISTVCTNVPGPREACRLLGRRILEVHPIVPLFQNMGMEFAIMSYGGRLSISAAVDPHLVPDADTIPVHLAGALDELRAALGGEQTLQEAPPLAAAPAPGPRVADLMTREVITIGGEDSLATADALMGTQRVRHLPVVHHAGRLTGLLTQRDLLAAAPSSIAHHSQEERTRLLGWIRAADVMETHLCVTMPDESAAAAGERMIQHKIGCLPVIDAEARLAGIVTEEDFLRWATAHMARAARRAAQTG
jgi:diacylglycerol O-acyltransferase